MLHAEPEEILVFADSQGRYVGFIDANEVGAENPEVYIVGYSSRPVALAYDRLEKVLSNSKPR